MPTKRMEMYRVGQIKHRHGHSSMTDHVVCTRLRYSGFSSLDCIPTSENGESEGLSRLGWVRSDGVAVVSKATMTSQRKRREHTV